MRSVGAAAHIPREAIVVGGVLLALLLQYNVLALILAASLFGRIVWKSHQELHHKRLALFRSLKEDAERPYDHTTQRAEWANALVVKCWSTFRLQIESLAPDIAHTLNQHHSSILVSAQFDEENFRLGNAVPLVERVDMDLHLPDHEIQFDFDYFYNSEVVWPVSVQFMPHLPPVNVGLSHLILRGRARIHIKFNQLKPALSEVMLCLVDMPMMDFRFGLGPVDLTTLPVLYHWVNHCFENALSSVVWPQNFVLRLNNHCSLLPLILSEPHHSNRPIVDIACTMVGEAIPDGWELIHRSITGMYPGDLNRGVPEAPELYLCVRRASEDETEGEPSPITALCVLFPEIPEVAPPSFFPITRTFGNQDANLNGNNPRRKCYLCLSRRLEDGNGSPITDIQVFNKSVEGNCTSEWGVVELSPFGHRANVNKGHASADEIYIAFRSQQKDLTKLSTPFGFVPQVVASDQAGLLRVTLVSAMNLRSMDVNGACDTYADIYISYGTGEKSISECKRTETVEKTLNPRWNYTTVFKASMGDFLNIFFYNTHSLKEELIGVLKFPLDTLRAGKPLTDWYELQGVSQGWAQVTIECLNFGLRESCQEGRPLHQIDASKPGKKIRKFRVLEKPTKPTEKNPLYLPSLQMVTTSLRKAGLERKLQEFLEDKNSPRQPAPFPTDEDLAEEIAEENKQLEKMNRPGTTFYVEKRGNMDRTTVSTSQSTFTSSSTKKPKVSKRWFVLKGDTFSCYKNAKEKNAMEQIKLTESKITQEDRSLTVRCPRLKWDLTAPSTTEAEEWAIALRTNTLVALQEVTASLHPEDMTPPCAPDSFLGTTSAE